MEEKAQTWECNVFVSGGTLNLKKNFWYAILWKWRKNGQPVMQTIPDNPDLEIHMTSGHDHENPRLVSHVKVSEGKCTLGVCLAPIGNNKTEYEYCLDEATKTHSCLLHAPLDHKKT